MIFTGTETEPTVKLELHFDKDGSAELVGSIAAGTEWLVATFTKEGHFQPNKMGCQHLGITLSTRFMQ